jgi:hypothetical protein
MISGFRREARVDKNCVLIGYCAASGGNSLPAFRNVLSVPFSREKRWAALEYGTDIRPETSVRNYHYWLRNNPENRSTNLNVVKTARLRRSNRLQVQKRTCDFQKAGSKSNCFRIALDNFIRNQVFKLVCFQYINPFFLSRTANFWMHTLFNIITAWLKRELKQPSLLMTFKTV